MLITENALLPLLHREEIKALNLTLILAPISYCCLGYMNYLYAGNISGFLNSYVYLPLQFGKVEYVTLSHES